LYLRHRLPQKGRHRLCSPMCFYKSKRISGIHGKIEEEERQSQSSLPQIFQSPLCVPKLLPNMRRGYATKGESTPNSGAKSVRISLAAGLLHFRSSSPITVSTYSDSGLGKCECSRFPRAGSKCCNASPFQTRHNDCGQRMGSEN
jgi:hypothetical protein